MPKFVNKAVADKWAQITYGCSHDEAKAINGEPFSKPGSFADRYRRQKHNATKRGIAWQMTFAEWVQIWLDSGKWLQRGRGKSGYCMARNGDVGPYCVGNVSIQTCVENSRDGIKVARPAILEHQRNNPQIGSGRGWTLRTGRRFTNPYQVMVGTKYVGCFPTQAEAESAYRNASQEIRHASNSTGVDR
jgi:hypothetical protein